VSFCGPPTWWALSPVSNRTLETAVIWPYDAAVHRIFSIPDVASNVILGLPLGVLLVAALGDVLILAAGAVGGAALHACYRAMLDSA
jgi:hypothetical protein